MPFRPGLSLFRRDGVFVSLNGLYSAGRAQKTRERSFAKGERDVFARRIDRERRQSVQPELQRYGLAGFNLIHYDEDAGFQENQVAAIFFHVRPITGRSIAYHVIVIFPGLEDDELAGSGG